MQYIKKTFSYGQHTVSIETGRIAKQANGAALVSMGDTVLLATCVASQEADPSRGFFPLTVDYQERTYAAGKIPGGFFRREGRPSEKETLTSRLIDRPLRPLFHKKFCNEVQVIITVVSLDPKVDPDIPALIAASAAVHLAGLPFAGPIGAVRVGLINNQHTLNPSFAELNASSLNLVMAGTNDSILMVESEANELSEQQMLDALAFGHEQMQIVIKNIVEFAEEAGVVKFPWQKPERDEEAVKAIRSATESPLKSAWAVTDKLERQQKVAATHNELIEQLAGGENPTHEGAVVKDVMGEFEKEMVRTNILDSGKRIDGRAVDDIRPISVEVGILPRAHGSALFTRGETQALVASTVGTDRDAQIIDALEGEYRESFMLHYNFPPYCVGETGRVGVTKRREVGHGRLAKRSMVAVIPSMEKFPYTIRVVSEITESNGSSSMASVCGSSLALMDAGVPIRAPVAGIAMGLIKEQDRHAILSDIMGDEDHLGDMDFKVAGTVKGITALQMDIKVQGISAEIMQKALEQAKAGRIHILKAMAEAIESPRDQLSQYAPRITTIKINPERIRDVIGKGGITIRSITEETGTEINIDDDGTVKVFSDNEQGAELARQRIEQLTADVEVGQIYEGRVAKLMDFGAFINILPGRDGLVHISQISNERVEHVSDELSEGDIVKVKVLEVDRQGRVRLSMKAVNNE
ncbi:MAG: polyribonucleotide nucleotidyltransferase [Candidatus Porifericomitaceae bacterium WSBS_2022_MAG_OTU9]